MSDDPKLEPVSVNLLKLYIVACFMLLIINDNLSTAVAGARSHKVEGNNKNSRTTAQVQHPVWSHSELLNCSIKARADISVFK